MHRDGRQDEQDDQHQEESDHYFFHNQIVRSP